ncbi:hypothetical protein [Acinetobacter baumannii]|uniref:hypothetical protein n=1 Tax=Acinetobacter baumannii TaxID=470 RepID=UPI001129AB12|nr:hypothetical protein [Acinetobacter baumannii]EHU2133733.1 hypothetical protein [Acinetobacter baumannii]TPR75254.1 hypothetical protein FJU89_02925 [Acinetobacter baumannii]
MKILKAIETGILIAALIVFLICLVAEIGKLRKKPANRWEKFLEKGGFSGIQVEKKEHDQ